MQKGIDVSKWNLVKDYWSIKTSGIVDFAILREGWGTGSVDSAFADNVKGFESVEIPILGVYHFSYALNNQDAKKEADFAVKQVEKAGLSPSTIIFFDYEYDSVDYSKRCGITPTKEKCTAMTETFCSRVEELGYKPGVYFNLDYKLNWYEAGFLDKYTCWIADWRVGRSYPDMAFHQYSNKGLIPGIVGDVDLNYYHGDSVKMEADKEERRQTLDEIAMEVIAGKWGNGQTRKDLLTAAGWDYISIQRIVNEILNS